MLNVQQFNGIVVSGDGEGRKFGFPTANIKAKNLFKPGIYSGLVKVGSISYLSAVIINPSRHGEIIEVHLIDENLNLYGKMVHVEVKNFIRPWQEFKDLDAGRKQIAEDIKLIKGI